LPKLKKLNLSGNPTQSPPLEIVERGVDAVKEYFRQRSDESEEDLDDSKLYEAKLLILGMGGAGKTTLVNKIKDPSYELRNEDSTKGIEVTQ
jgi:internalin A